MAERPPCRCLLAEAHPDLALTVREYIDSLPPETLASDEVRAARLRICLDCAFLRDGTCARCGCYAEARAARRAQRCPDAPPRWTEEP